MVLEIGSNQLGLPFPNLPYLIDGNVKLTQSGAIIRYLARKHNLIGTTEDEQRQQDLIDGVIGDIRSGWSMLCYRPNDFDADKLIYRKDRLTPVLAELDKWFAKKRICRRK
ncbi:putative Glutathione S-transferase 2 [Hypsibius exemplaris]|uniref:glutathione transferase n=1 Tax=Hypsibius exemplaris TaxID=2072580 RepID=A0A9X6RNN1_HYPEX|nr:putative Glutathione S-transferase 2 [Hypsibius exemplaris]